MSLPGFYNLTITQTGYFPVSVTNIDLRARGTVVSRATPIVISKTAAVTVTTKSFDGLTPSGLVVELIDVNNTSRVITPRPGTSIYDVEPGDYFARASAPGYPEQRTSDTPVEIGDEVTLEVLLPRIVRVGVTGPTTATVELIGASGIAPLPQATTSPFEFVIDPVVGPPATLQAKVTATGFRTRIVDIPTTIINDPAVPVSLLPTTITGTITGAGKWHQHHHGTDPGDGNRDGDLLGQHGDRDLVLGVGGRRRRQRCRTIVEAHLQPARRGVRYDRCRRHRYGHRAGNAN